MRPIPLKLRKELAAEPYMQVCALHFLGGCSRKIEWHHVWIYAGRQVNERWAILPACNFHHENVKKDRKIKELFEVLSLETASEADLEKYPRKDWKQIKKYLYA